MAAGEDLRHVSFKDVAWLQNFALTETTILDYFALSQFYERTCNNEVLRMQARYTDHPTSGDPSQQLHRMTGIEYGLMTSKPPNLFIIGKWQRHSPQRTALLACYYVLEGAIYMAPSVRDVLEGRLVSAAHHLREALSYGAGHVTFAPARRQYQATEVMGKDSGTGTTSNEHGDGDAGSTSFVDRQLVLQMERVMATADVTNTDQTV